MVLAVRMFVIGMLDALSFHKTLVFFVHDAKVGWCSVKCFCLNGVIFVGGILLFNNVLLPITRHFRSMIGFHATGDAALAFEAHSPLAGEALDAVLSLIFKALWTIPIYLLSFVLNTIWYQDIADQAYARHMGRPRLQTPVAMVRDFVFQTLVLLALLVQSQVLRITLGTVERLLWGRSYIGFAAFVAYMSWSFALYAFDYKWALRGWNVATRFDHVERHWAFFLGFGLPCTLLTILFPYFISYGVYSYMFPLFILLAIRSDEAAGLLSQTTTDALDTPCGQFHILKQAKWMSNRVIRGIGRYCGWDMSAAPKRRRVSTPEGAVKQ